MTDQIQPAEASLDGELDQVVEMPAVETSLETGTRKRRLLGFYAGCVIAAAIILVVFTMQQVERIEPQNAADVAFAAEHAQYTAAWAAYDDALAATNAKDTIDLDEGIAAWGAARAKLDLITLIGLTTPEDEGLLACASAIRTDTDRLADALLVDYLQGDDEHADATWAKVSELARCVPEALTD